MGRVLERTGRVLAPPVDLERRHITGLAALTLLGGATITLTGCGGGSAGPTAPAVPTPAPPPPTTTASGCPADAVCGQVSVDPAHSAVITGAQLAAGGALVLDIRGTATHTHTVSLSADEVVAVRNRTRVEKTSSTAFNHQHTVTFN